MKSFRWNVSAGAILFFSLAYFFDGSGVVSAAVPAALAHELGHAAALRLCRCRLKRFSLTLTGAQLDYAPRLDGLPSILCCLAGPAAGIVYAVAACTAGGAYWQMSGAVSFLLSVFNLLPILPLDGGRIMAVLLQEKAACSVSRAAALLLFAGGAAVAFRFRSFAMLLMGAWLFACNLPARGIDPMKE